MYIMKKGFKKLQINISNKDLNDLKKLQDEMEVTSMAEVIRSSLKVYKYLEAQKKEGNKIIVRNPKSKTDIEVLI